MNHFSSTISSLESLCAKSNPIMIPPENSNPSNPHSSRLRKDLLWRPSFKFVSGTVDWKKYGIFNPGLTSHRGLLMFNWRQAPRTTELWGFSDRKCLEPSGRRRVPRITGGIERIWLMCYYKQRYALNLLFWISSGVNSGMRKNRAGEIDWSKARKNTSWIIFLHFYSISYVI